MTPERHELLGELFEQACDLDLRAQAAFLKRLSADEPELARELAALLAQDRAPADTLDAGLGTGGMLVSPFENTASAVIGPGTPSAIDGVADLEVVSCLGAGGMGQVLLARQRSLGREVAVKVLRPDVASSSLADSLFSEAILAGSLEHPHIVPVHLLARDRQGLPVLVMKRVEGVAWSRLIAEEDHPGWAPLLQDGSDRLAVHLSILSSVCHALHFAHSRGVIHRDIKPDNIMVGAFGEVYLVDWGIATRKIQVHSENEPSADRGAGRIAGTPGYLAPEMLDEGRPLDARTDVYLLGATLHYVLTGTPRHRGRTLLARYQSALLSLPVEYGAEVPEELGAICNRATNADPRERFPSAEAFRDAIVEFLRHRDSIRLSDHAWERLGQLRARLGEKQTDAPAPAEPRHPHELMIECHFGFHESLRIWPKNARAQKGLRGCLMAMVEYEVEQESLSRAQGLLREIDDPPAELLARVASLQTRVRERGLREERLRELLRSQDWSVSARQRVVFYLLASALCLMLWRIAVRDQHVAPHAIPPLTLALYMLAGLLVMIVLVTVYRRQLFATAVGRHVVLGAVCLAGGMCTSRALHAIPSTLTADIVASDHVLAATATSIGAVMLARWMWLIPPFFLVGALVARLFPAYAGASFAVASVWGVGVGLFFTPQGWRKSPVE